ncbi:MAG: FliM/FliN family flagellar motor C-terminal domain-containing protein [Planctomycetia bacterium]|nr:FliM/FliN family flagellar motor C-terminal domain-containing protein [Planctomycetia bacterium]
MSECPSPTTNPEFTGNTYDLRAGRVRRPLAELIRLAPGDEISVEPVETESSMEGIPVEILRDRRRVALGELVRTNGTLAIRVVQIFTPSPETIPPPGNACADRREDGSSPMEGDIP